MEIKKKEVTFFQIELTIAGTPWKINARASLDMNKLRNGADKESYNVMNEFEWSFIKY